ncbi:MAG: TonB family protein [Candidatus Acidiferrum sp.]
MSEASKEWTGEIVEGIFPLRQHLGGSEHSAVFLTEHDGAGARKAVIKLVPADEGTAEAQLSNWSDAADLSHPNLLKLFRNGRCRLGGHNLLYVVMECAEENLSEILPQRALTADEARDMLGPVLEALEYLHTKGLLHGDLKPANILASGDRLKLSSDTISKIGEPQITSRRPGAYDPPEAISGVLTAAADVWSLGTTLVEVLTQRLPEWQPGPHREPVVPSNLPEPLREIAQMCLQLEPRRRASIPEIAARLNPKAAVAMASVSASRSASSSVAGGSFDATPAGRISSTMSEAVARRVVAPRAAARLQSNPHRPPPYMGPHAKSRIITLLAIGAVIFAAILTVPRLFTHHPKSNSVAIVSPKLPPLPPEGKRPETAVSSKQRAAPEREIAASRTAKSAAAKHSIAEGTGQAAPQDTLKIASQKEPTAAPLSPRPSADSAEIVSPAAAGMASSKGEVLDQILPEVSDGARATIRGKVRVGIKLHVDAAGAVTNAELDSPGPSRFFADRALEAAKAWVFTPPEINGKSVASEWSLQFVFTHSDTKVTPVQTAP